MNTYSVFLISTGECQQTAPFQTVERDTDAQVFEYAYKILGRMRTLDAVEVWAGGEKLIRVGGRPASRNSFGGLFGRQAQARAG